MCVAVYYGCVVICASVCLFFVCVIFFLHVVDFFFQAEDGIRVLVRSRGLGDVYKRQGGGGGNMSVNLQSMGGK